MPDAPKLIIETTPGIPPQYAIKGWEDVDLFRRRNHALWQAISKRCDWGNVAEIDRLKMLCAGLADQVDQLRELWVPGRRPF